MSASTIRPAGMHLSGSTKQTILRSASRCADVLPAPLRNEACATWLVVYWFTGLQNKTATYSAYSCACQHSQVSGCLCVCNTLGDGPWLRLATRPSRGKEEQGQACLLNTEHAHVSSEGAVHVGCRARRPWRA